MKALLLAAGFGSRLRPLTDNIPKCLVPIHGKPLLDYWLDLLIPNGIDRILINTHYLSDKVQQHISQSRWHGHIDQVHETKLLGTGGTLRANAHYFSNEAFFVAHADNLTQFDPQAFIKTHQNRDDSTLITMMTFDTDTPSTCGIVELDPNNHVVAFHEKQANPPGRRANAAVFIFEPEVLTYIQSLDKTEIDISLDVIGHFLGRIQTFHNDQYHRDIGNLESLRLAELEFPTP